MNEWDFPHLVELELPPGGFRNKSQEFESLRRERGIVIRRGCGRHEGEQFHFRFCCPNAATANAFCETLRRQTLGLFTLKARGPNCDISAPTHRASAAAIS
jgi:hypothetical protein